MKIIKLKGAIPLSKEQMKKIGGGTFDSYFYAAGGGQVPFCPDGTYACCGGGGCVCNDNNQQAFCPGGGGPGFSIC